ncbi:Hsp20/alpha crystallin family protein [Thermospira aquatica]|uniref:Hsp20/alpha crystallin family protein n=1 Tax=Thermospira aquatica TaxID=2828656 RepID=A0AAX3BAW5_9SPIR|nr:Hsp20/alpha crystallin family protein [Thermospira aquatica]URA09372.1 Hsp20/alpha crystallin family protein [Thermospira aquatica]
MKLIRRNTNPISWLDDFFRTDWVTTFDGTPWSFNVDLEETDKAIVVKADLPGMDEKDIKVELSNNILTISGSRSEKREEKNKNYHRIERFEGSFCRSIELPREVDANKAKAEYKKGVLTIELPKVGESKTKKIDVKIS